MEEEKLIAFIEESFHPEPYPDKVEGCLAVKKLFVLNHKKSARYILAVAPWVTDRPAKDQLSNMRSEVRSALKASYPFRNLGIIIFWYGPEDTWRTAIDEISPDVHGVRSTIVQGLVFLDPHTGVSEILQSSWGPIGFGDWQGQFSKIKAFCSTKQTYSQRLESDVEDSAI